ncbi:hypothetical protein VN12_26660 [Pirellula sp. SH-Sr6A]|uniref:hypothetical protein n=1 Tax=Pirellula sp. SH-Sr6A TaxID=1632865 RepID=UPI00078D60C6|nr:hypothetical protein [Pirellula sp. SH-Sr6A]AMV35703.1 hypothetical protein VN12_26660 [Pirellula sp. SH-Sr6A]
MVDKQKLVEEYVDGIMLQIRKTRPAGPVTQEEEIGNHERLRKLGLQLIEEIADKESLYLRMWNGTFRPDNRCSREMFQKLTGLQLPPGVKATREFLIAYIGPEWVSQQQEKERAEREAEAKRDREQQEAYYAGLMDEIATRTKSGQNISGRELVNLARHIGIQVHPRTAGAATNVEWITVHRAGVRKNCNAQGCFRLLRDVLELLNEEAPEEEGATDLARELFHAS